MPYSTIVDGKVLDWKFIYQKEAERYLFYVGETVWGLIYKNTVRNQVEWTAIPFEESFPYVVNGFASRYRAAEFVVEWIRFQKTAKKYAEVDKITDLQ